MNFRFLRRYLFLNLCLVFLTIFYFTALFGHSFIDDIVFKLTGFWLAGSNFLHNMDMFNFLSYFLFLLEIPLRFLIMKFILKKEETLTPLPKTKNKFLRFLDGLYTFLLSITAFYGFFICWVNYFLFMN